MLIQINSDHSITVNERLNSHLEGVITDELDHFTTQITRIEVHLSDVNGDKGGDMDKRCMIEARVEGRPPTAVTNLAATIEEAVTGAATKMKRALEHELGKLREHHRHDVPDLEPDVV
jgi:hypothetical protein